MGKWLTLMAHPASEDTAVVDIKVYMERIALTTLKLVYRVTSGDGSICIPVKMPSLRTNELWRHTCAELFIAAPGEAAYCEFNFSPSTQWAAYQFTAYRQGMRILDCAAPTIEATHVDRQLLIEVQLELPSQFNYCAELHIALSMVIEELQGRCSYWALAHPAAVPDFHHRSGFVVTI